ncbi:hypothetical protein [Oceanobacillus neutriphilus]|uniref:hypothetical protein n=1 Tax=Oceanobacillus neutriphilus TaxID=531815 RepID=UPI001E308AD6|nr:hypothetical protein [Oceanobacillus neutriphilus]
MQSINYRMGFLFQRGNVIPNPAKKLSFLWVAECAGYFLQHLDHVHTPLLFCIFMFLFIEIFGSYIISAFGGSTDPKFLETATFGMRIFCCMVSIVGVQMIGANFFQYIGNARKAIFLSLLRQLILLVPLVYILPKFLGLLGVWLATPIADFISFYSSYIVFMDSIQKIQA